jgi:anti-sigma factor RsiW
MKGAMNSDRFEALLEAKGADLATWPEAERRAAERLLAGSPEARAALAQAQALDDLLNPTLAPTPAGQDLREAILALPVAHPRQAAARPTVGFRTFWQAGLGMALAAGLAGFALGITGLVEGPGSAAEEADIAALIYGFSAQGPRP